jgi:PAS domain-containing protein
MTEIASRLAVSPGDDCVILAFSGEGAMVPVAVSAADPGVEPAVRHAFSAGALGGDGQSLLGRLVSAPAPARVGGGTAAVAAGCPPALAELFVATRTQSLLSAPMHRSGGAYVPRNNQAVGVVLMMRRDPGGYSDRETDLVGDVADRAGLAYVNARLRETTGAAQQRFRTAAELVSDGLDVLVAVRDADAKITDFRYEYANDASCRLRRLSREQLVGHQLFEVPPALRSHELAADLARVVETGERLSKSRQAVAEVWPKADPEVSALDLRAAKLGDGLVVALRDVTDGAGAAGAAAPGEEWLRSAFARSPAGLAIASLEPGDRGRLLEVNLAFCDLTGFDRSRLVGMWLGDIFEGDDGGAGPADRAAAVAPLYAGRRHLCRCRRAGGPRIC